MGDDGLLKEFLVEAKENLDVLDQSLVGLERRPGDREIVDNIFRSLHSIKGTAGFFDFSKLESVAHAGENLLNAVREDRVRIDTGTTSLLLSVLDSMREILAAIERSGAEGESDPSSLVARLHTATEGASPDVAEPSQPPAAPAPPSAPAATPMPASPMPATPVPTAASTAAEPHSSAPPPSPPAPATGSPPTAKAEHGTHQEEGADTIRVGVGLLDELMDLVGELVLSRNQILQITARQTDAQITQSAQQLNRITTELQERVMKTRMQPIKQVWSRLPRVVRDLSVQLGKQVRVEMEGKETELDRTLIEAIKDPLTHLVRNAVDHGIEKPADRRARGKPEEGRFLLRAYHESGQVIIEVPDDDRGIDPVKIKAKAVEKGIITPDQAAGMSEKDALNLIFRAGFSTAEKVTNVSGRGVGMDVVRSNIERIGGSIEVESAVDAGTSFRIKIPLTLAIVPALMVSAREASFAIPQVSVVELIRVKSTEVDKAVEVVQGTIATRLRGRLLPLIDFRELLEGRSAMTLEALSRRRQADPAMTLNIVVMQGQKGKFGLLVDGIEGSQEIVVKPLGRQLQDIPIYAGATILGDGRVALILDTLGVAQEAGLASQSAYAAKDQAVNAVAQEDMQSVLLVEDEASSRYAVPLASVARLEKLPMERIENVAGREVVQYGEEILRLVRVHDIAPGGGGGKPRAADVRSVYVIVLQDQGSPVGLVMERVVDVAETPRSRLKPAMRRGVLGTAVVREKITEFLDVDAVRRVLAAEVTA